MVGIRGADGIYENEDPPLLQHYRIKRTGNLWSALAYIITGVIGSGVLSLPWSMAQLGWIAGPLALLVFAIVTLISALLLCDCHLYPHPENGPSRNSSYLEAVKSILGDRNARVFALLAHFNLFKLGVVYTITSAISIRAIQKSNCFHRQGHEATCEYGQRLYMLLFGVVQIFVSLVPDFHNVRWLSVVAATMSFAYSLIGSGLGLAKLIGNGRIEGTIGGVPTANPTQKAWLIAQALGDIAFAYPYSLILIEIQDTLRSPPSEKVTMRKASVVAVSTTTVLYFCCAGFGYAAFGSSTPGNLLTGFGFYEPFWLIDFANACIVVHLVGAYQVYTQSLFAIVEGWLAAKYPESGFINDNYSFKLASLSACRLSPLRLCFRTAYVVVTTGIAMLFPYFNEMVAFAGSITFWPLTIYFPIQMYSAQNKIKPWTSKWLLLRAYAIAGLLVAMFALVGSIQGLISKRFG